MFIETPNPHTPRLKIDAHVKQSCNRNRTLRSAGARGLHISSFYRHIAPLERNEPMNQLRFTHHVSFPSHMPPRWGFESGKFIGFSIRAICVILLIRDSDKFLLTLHESRFISICVFAPSRPRVKFFSRFIPVAF